MEGITGEKRIALIGAGCGRKDLTLAAKEMLESARLLIGSKRMLSMFSDTDAERIVCTDPVQIAKCILERKEASGTVCVLFSGDTGFYSAAESLTRILKRDGITAEWFPGISSVMAFTAWLGRSWQSLRLVSAHGVDTDPVHEVMQGVDVLFLTGGADGPKEICRILCEAGLSDLKVTVGEELGAEKERIRSGKAEDFCGSEAAPLNVMLVSAAPVYGGVTLGIPDDHFRRGAVPMTKQNIRPLILSKISSKRNEVCWDIGAGTGSVSVELSFAAHTIYAVEKAPDALALIEENRRKFCAWNIRIIPGEAPEVCKDLPAPDAVFIGGSSGRLEEIIRYIEQRNKAARICVSSVTVETAARAAEIFRKFGFSYEVTQVSVSHTNAGEAASILHAENPVTLITGWADPSSA